ncbi:MAG TPA: hypothetical protein VHX65_09945 [Pirellulales bacterium]|nr:hypothetical protein [Pirellulales bacterium]
MFTVEDGIAVHKGPTTKGQGAVNRPAAPAKLQTRETASEQ